MPKRRLLALILLVIFVLSASCSLAEPAPSVEPAAAEIDPIILVTEDPHATHTPTPFQPEPATPTATSTPTATATPTATPTVPSTPTPAPTEVPPTPTIDLPQGYVNILIMGTDLRSIDPSFRTDVMLWVAINAQQKKVSIISFPRDLWVNLPGIGMQRINTSQELGGFIETQLMFKANFGYVPDHYVLTNFAGFTSIIDTLGGIEVNAAVNLTDKCDLSDYHGICSVGPGMVHMDSKMALWYVRSRYTTSDVDRGRRAQEVILAIFRRLLSLDAVAQVPQLFDQFRSMVETDLSIDDILPLLPSITELGDGSSIQRFQIGYQQAYDWITPDGARVLVPYPGAVQAIFSQAMSK